MSNKKKLPVGVDSFNKLVQHDFYYIDKTGLLVELLKNWAEVNLFGSETVGNTFYQTETIWKKSQYVYAADIF